MAKRNAKKRQKYAEKHPKTYKGKKRGRKPVRANARYIPTTLSNGDTPIDLLRKCRNMLLQSGEKWTDAQKERANVLFGKYPKIKKAYCLLCSLRSILRDTTLNKETAKSSTILLKDQLTHPQNHLTLKSKTSGRNCMEYLM